MPWTESHTVLIRHRKLVELATALRIRPAHAIGHLHALWHAALEQQEDGDLSAWSDEFIAQASDYPGDAPQYVRLLQKFRWLDGRIIHDWLDYAGRYLDVKYRTRNPKRLDEIKAKHDRQTVARPKSDSGPTQDGQPDRTNLTNKQREKESSARPSLEQVKQRCQLIGCPEAEGEAFWNHFEASGWIDRNGHRIQSWEAKLASWATNARAKPLEGQHHAGKQQRTLSPLDLKTILTAKERKAEALRNKHCSPTASGDIWGDDAVFKQWRALRKEIRELNERLSALA